jgi:hypothetical protein
MTALVAFSEVRAGISRIVLKSNFKNIINISGNYIVEKTEKTQAVLLKVLI